MDTKDIRAVSALKREALRVALAEAGRCATPEAVQRLENAIMEHDRAVDAVSRLGNAIHYATAILAEADRSVSR